MLYNSGFEQLVRTRLGAKTIPQNIFRMANDEDGSCKKLQELVEEQIKGVQKIPHMAPLHDGKLKKIEVMLVKQ
jgi:hypothetical protein